LAIFVKALAVALTKIANDIRWLGSGPRCGIGELHLPANEPGSSIMPGKVNPSQCEALLMLCARVVGNDTTVSIAGASGSFELNVCKPLIIHTVLESLGLLGDGMDRFARYCIDGLAVDRQVVDGYVEQSLMLVTALASSLGYDNAAKIAQRAWENRCSLREAALESGMISAEEYDRQVRPETMTGENLQ
jgi:fumarate hydratase class II